MIEQVSYRFAFSAVLLRHGASMGPRTLKQPVQRSNKGGLSPVLTGISRPGRRSRSTIPTPAPVVKFRKRLKASDQGERVASGGYPGFSE